jgi:Protein of unknown function (DUF3151)
MRNLMPEPAPTHLPQETAAASALDDAVARIDAGTSDAGPALRAVAGRFPAYSAGWASLAAQSIRSGDPVAAYAFARTGYHRGLDQLRRAGWRGAGLIPWSHEPNQGFLRSLWLLAAAADAIGEADEAARCAQFLRDCDPVAVDALAG